MTHSLPTVAVELLNGQSHASDIAEAMTLAYWMHGRDDSCAQFHLAAIHSRFAALADALGYTIALKPEPADAAEPAQVAS